MAFQQGRADEPECAVVAALHSGFARLSFPASRLTLPGMLPAGSLSPGRRLAADNLVAVTGEILTSAARLDTCDSAAEFLDLQPVELERLPGLPGSLTQVADSLSRYLPAAHDILRLLLAAGRELHAAFALLTPAEKVLLRRLALGFEFWRDEWPDSPVRRMLELAAKVDRARIARAGACLNACVELIRGAGVTSPPDSMISLATPWGDILLGTAGNDHYSSRALLIVDPGGDDTYAVPGGGWPDISVIADLGGDDAYEANGGQALGGAVCGVAWLDDAGGDDTYRAGEFSLGCGALGLGVLVDRAGDDSYQGTALTQGAAFYGLGALVDMAGEDTYRAEFGAQGACFAGGDAVLADLSGDDSYLACGVYRDYRSATASKSFAQGCAAGIRPFAFGGRAALIDRAGENHFEISFLGQGAGYWGGLGLLLAGGGGDTFTAETYAQGCGLHLGVGALLDRGGDDSYALEGVGQGCGEDRAWGLLLECGGDDSYRGVRLARGAGGTGGVGLLLELGGDDSYPTAGQLTDGAGYRTWELPGIGLMFDMAGEDTYPEGFGNGRVEENDTWGARIDISR